MSKFTNQLCHTSFEVGIYEVTARLTKFMDDVQLETRMDDRLVSIQTFAAAVYYEHLPVALTPQRLAQHNQQWLKDMAMSAIVDRAFVASQRTPAAGADEVWYEGDKNGEIVRTVTKSPKP